MTEETLFLVGFFRFHEEGSKYGFERMHLHGIFKTEEEARKEMSFCDEAGWYEGALIEEREYGHQLNFFVGKRIWLLQENDGSMKEMEEPSYFNHVVNLIG